MVMNQIEDLQNKLAKALETLELIATKQRPDGTWNRDRKACQELAQKTLDTLKLNEASYDFVEI